MPEMLQQWFNGHGLGGDCAEGEPPVMGDAMPVRHEPFPGVCHRQSTIGLLLLCVLYSCRAHCLCLDSRDGSVGGDWFRAAIYVFFVFSRVGPKAPTKAAQRTSILYSNYIDCLLIA